MIGGNGVYLTPTVEEIKINLSNGGSVITPGLGRAYYPVTHYGTITGWRIVGDQTGSITVRILKQHNAIPTASNHITGSEPPSLSSAVIGSDTDLTTWTTRSIVPGDILGLDIVSVSNFLNITISLIVEK